MIKTDQFIRLLITASKPLHFRLTWSYLRMFLLCSSSLLIHHLFILLVLLWNERLDDLLVWFWRQYDTVLSLDLFSVILLVWFDAVSQIKCQSVTDACFRSVGLFIPFWNWERERERERESLCVWVWKAYGVSDEL